jgi:ribosome-associated toxin RatA of RatAB toxin-antitoxin module
MPHIHHEGLAEAPVNVLFDYVDDYRNTTQWLFGLSKFEPSTDVIQGLGAEFDGTFAVKPVKLHSSVRITEWEKDKVIALESYKGFQITSTWHFTSTGPETSKVVVDFTYELPGGLAGRAMGKAMEPIVALSIRHSDDSLRKHVRAAYARGK